MTRLHPRPFTCQKETRRGAVLPLFALLLPIFLILSAFAINLAYMQLTKTELKIATDSAARAGGRAWSEYQEVTQAKTFAANAAAANKVAGQGLVLSHNDADNEIEFGVSGRVGYGRLTFTKKATPAVAAGTTEATSVRINGKRTSGSGSGSINLLLGGIGNHSAFEPTARSVSTQVDRDIALVLDKSGSMAYNHDEDAMYELLDDLRDAGLIWNSEFNDAVQGHDGSASGLYARYFSPNVILQLTALGTNLGNEVAAYGTAMNIYTAGDASGAGHGPAPPFSRWALLYSAVESFIDVLEATDQEEQVSLALFDSSGYLEHYLEYDFDEILQTVNETIPYQGTSIGEGMQEALEALTANEARPYAAKTIVVMTDGVNNSGEISPVTVANEIVAAHNVTIHTVTFTDGADQNAMQEVAEVGGGKSYHANDSSELIEIFEEIANNLPTVITQ